MSAADHPAPKTPGVQFTERDPHLNELYEDLRLGQFTLETLDSLSNERLLYIAGHWRKPETIHPLEWEKLEVNAWRAGRVFELKQAARLQLRVTVFSGCLAVVSVMLGSLGTWLLSR